MITITDLLPGDQLRHAPMDDGGTLLSPPVPDGGTCFRLELNPTSYIVCDAGFRLWWDVTRNGVLIHAHTGDVEILLSSGRVVERPISEVAS